MSGLSDNKRRPAPRPAPPETPNDLAPQVYRGCAVTSPRCGTLRALPTATPPPRRRQPRSGNRSCPAGRPTQPIVLDPPEGIHVGVACWSTRERWLHVTAPTAYDLRYRAIRPQMRSGGISRPALLAVAAARAAHADHRTGRDCRPSNARLVAITGLSLRQVQRADEALRLLGVATEVMRGRQRTLTERMASWRAGDRARGWASLWVLHDTPIALPANTSVTPHLARVPKGTTSPRELLTTSHGPAGRGQRARRRARANEDGTRLARAWRAHDNAPPWCRRHSSEAWSHVLAPAARHGWTPRDLNAAVTDWLRTGHSIPDNPSKPIALLGGILRGANLDERPTALDDARQREELAQRRIEREHARAQRREHHLARQAGRAALSGPGRAQCRRELAAAAERRRLRLYQDSAATPSSPLHSPTR